MGIRTPDLLHAMLGRPVASCSHVPFYQHVRPLHVAVRRPISPPDCSRSCSPPMPGNAPESLTPPPRQDHDGRMDLGRISVDHRIMGGVPCVAGTRIPVATVVGLVANGLTGDQILAEYPQLSIDDVQACLGYAARAVDERELPVRLSA